MKRILFSLCSTLVFIGCSSATTSTTETSVPAESQTVVVTYSVLGAIVSELVGEMAEVKVIIPDGQDPHDFEPSAKDIEAMNSADLIVSNGLGLEEGLDNALIAADQRGTPHFVVSDHVTTRTGGSHSHESEDADHSHGSEDADHSHGSEEPEESDHAAEEESAIDPHLWLSPHTMSEMLDDLGEALESALGIDVSAAATSMSASLDALDVAISTRITGLDSCTLVTGHDELGYFADRYGCTVVGTVIPSFSTTAEASAGELAEIGALVREYKVKAIFTGLGTADDVADRLSEELGVPAIELATHYLDGVSNYEAFMNRLVDQIVEGLS